jgi:hypothetical protein
VISRVSDGGLRKCYNLGVAWDVGRNLRGEKKKGGGGWKRRIEYGPPIMDITRPGPTGNPSGSDPWRWKTGWIDTQIITPETGRRSPGRLDWRAFGWVTSLEECSNLVMRENDLASTTAMYLGSLRDHLDSTFLVPKNEPPWERSSRIPPKSATSTSYSNRGFANPIRG